MAASKKTAEKKVNPNLEVWNALRSIDKKYVSKITGRSYRGDSAKPQAIYKKMTEHFGPVGLGWGFEVVERWTTEFPDKDGTIDRIDANCRVRVWAMQVKDVQGGFWEYVGQGKLMYYSQNGKRICNDDGWKISVTDALTKALSVIGCAADIHMGEYDPRYREDTEEDAPRSEERSHKSDEDNEVPSKPEVSPGQKLKNAFDARCKAISVKPNYDALNKICTDLGVDKVKGKEIQDNFPKLLSVVMKWKPPMEEPEKGEEPEGASEQTPMSYMHGAITKEMGVDSDTAHELLHSGLLEEHEGSLTKVKTMDEAAAVVKRTISIINGDDTSPE